MTTTIKDASISRRTLFGAAAAAVGCLLAPARALAEDAVSTDSGTLGDYPANVMAFSMADDGRGYPYYTTDAAIQAGYEGKVIYLNVDWLFTGTMTVADSKSLTIDMNGHKIQNLGNGAAIRLYENSSLTLCSNVPDVATTFYYTGFDAATGDAMDASVIAGGLVTGGSNTFGGAFRMDNRSTLTLDNVAVAGNHAKQGGGIYAKENCNIYVKNGASIQHNRAIKGSGIYVNQDDTNIFMDNGFISDNHAYQCGGGIYSDDNGTRVHLENKSSICGNCAESDGGGLYFYQSWLNVVSDDGTGSVSGNTAEGSGGGIYINPVQTAIYTTSGSLTGLTISENVANGEGGGGVYQGQKDIEIVNCTITENYGSNGGGVYFNCFNAVINGCTITENTCGVRGVGGGVTSYCLVSNLFTLCGVCQIKDNTRGKYGSDDDFFFSASSYRPLTTYICITGGVDQGSHVGVRTDVDGNQPIGRKITTFYEGTYFMNTDGYQILHDDEGEMWQAKIKS